MNKTEYRLINGQWEVKRNPFENLTREQKRALIFGIQDEISKIPGAVFGDSDLCPLKHSFAPGVYVREIFIPAGTFIVGKIHKHEHPNFLMSGEVSYLTEFGEVERIKAPKSMMSPAGTKRVVYAHQDTTWVTVHITDKTDLKEIEEEIIATDYNEIEMEDKICLGAS